ncbi:multicopper oxidase domain-containing protein [Amycolatopsis jiangsuensis]|uniref:FtsP/CotA-like multicopper oxidase with cupredoxin domain n=1 Tax=Amycolatopsis jiangsuensis TaxID=1181879 RepID=A0A840J224_9PSEU|nr:multicopper oxidase domain-containing protein [Amycolatopsis jiangsuensis]MBB4689066.1 FtsP/CotA-like multicopper oxidase with cupredoxin domain [Amycolatopsis jiangsuensis]
MDRKTKSGLSRRSMLAGTAAGVLAPVVVAGAGATPAAAAGQARNITLYADTVAGTTRVGYGLEPGKPTIPGPLLECYEGDTLVIELVNRTDQRLSIHPHGVNYETTSDGSPLNNSFNEPYETKTYTWKTRTASQAANGFWMPGSAGYWHYHDHALGGDHGTAGLMKGLYGGLIVRKRGDLLPSKQFTVVFTEMWINHQMAPDTPIFEANLGERVEFICIGHGNLMHTFHLHAHRWADTRTGMLTSATDNASIVDNKTLDPGCSFGFQVIAGSGVGPGAWMYHCHVQQHSDDGMSGLFLVREADGGMPPGAQDAIDHFKGHHHPTAKPEGSTDAAASAHMHH